MTEDTERKSIELLFWSWGHDLAKKAMAIRDLVYLIKSSLIGQTADIALINSRLEKIDRFASEIARTPLPFEHEQIPLNELIQNLVEWLKSLEFYHTVAFELNLDPSQPLVTANPAWLRRVFEILIENAVEAMGGLEAKQIEIGTQTEGTGVTVAVKDRGKGIDKELLPKLLQGSPSPRPDGKGRGLYIARLAVELYGGKIEINTAPTGTIIAIWLPLSDMSRSSRA